MNVDILKSGTCKSSDDSVYKSISMMNDFVTKAFPYETYDISQIVELELHDDEKMMVMKALSCESDFIHREYIGKDDLGRMYFTNRTH